MPLFGCFVPQILGDPSLWASARLWEHFSTWLQGSRDEVEVHGAEFFFHVTGKKLSGDDGC